MLVAVIPVRSLKNVADCEVRLFAVRDK